MFKIIWHFPPYRSFKSDISRALIFSKIGTVCTAYTIPGISDGLREFMTIVLTSPCRRKERNLYKVVISS